MVRLSIPASRPAPLLLAAALGLAACGTSSAATPTDGSPEVSPEVSVGDLVAETGDGSDSIEALPSENPPMDDASEGEPAERGPEGSGRPVTIAFGGDIHFEQVIAEDLAADPTTVLDPVAAMLADADLAIANLETAVTERGTPSAKQFNFRTGPAAFDALRASGIDVVSMANNHGLDYGQEGLEDSLAHAAEAGFPVVGIGADADEAYAPYSTEINGQRIAVIGATQVLDSALIASWTATDEQPGLASAKEVATLVAAVEAARVDHDTVIVFLHWGIEGETCPAPRQQELADQLVAAGADIIVGGHAHRVQGGGYKGEAFVHYGLGNFVFYTAGGPGADSGVLRLTVTGRRIDRHEWVPARLQRGVATELEPDVAPGVVEAWEQLRSCTDLAPAPGPDPSLAAPPDSVGEPGLGSGTAD